MKNFLIYKSSAGSGKTYTLVKEYLRLALSGKNEYRHTLAVTFTNKAAEEMKTRIISSLVSLSSGENSSLKSQLEKEGVTGDIQQKASEVLKNILHRYSDFSIHTIDSFLLNIVRAFAREIKLQLGYNIEIEDKYVLEKIVEELLDEAGENKELTLYLENFIFYSMDENKGWKIDLKIKELAGEIFKERYWIKRGEGGLLDDNREKTGDFIQTLFKIISSFEKQMVQYSLEAEKIMLEHSLSIEDFSHGKNGVMNYLINKIRNSDYDPKSRIKQFSQSVSAWYTKTASFAVKESIRKAADAGLFEILKSVVNLYEKHSTPYNTARELIKTIYVLGIFKDLMNKLKEYRDENKIMLLSDMNNILMKVISGENSPFVYEKTGSFYKNFLIDEFQDTSTFQWKNFLPLVINSVSEGNFSMIVGDVKQSIYRWRNGNMKLLLEGVYDDLSEFSGNIGEKNLNDNYRSRHDIIKFNNTFFKAATEVLSTEIAKLPMPADFYSQKPVEVESQPIKTESTNGLPLQPSLFDEPPAVEVSIMEAAAAFSLDRTIQEYNLLAESYRDVEQTPAKAGKEEKKGGFISIIGTQDDEENHISSKTKASQRLVEIVKSTLANGYMQKDILVLTRTKWEGSEAAHYLVDAGLKVVSNESLLLNGSPKVKLIIAILKYIADNRNVNAKTEILYVYLAYFKNYSQVELDKVFNDYKNKTSTLFHESLPGEFFSGVDSDTINPLFYKLSLYELIEKLVSLFELNKSNDAHLLRFMDALREFSSKSTNDLTGFVEWWNTNRDDYSIVVPDGEDAVRVMTIHKAKGLQSPVVIIPYACWELGSSSRDLMWVSSDVPPFNESPAYLVRVNKDLKNTYFEKDYKEETSQIYLDNFNLLYVAFTRAIDELHVITPVIKRNNTAETLINKTLVTEKLKGFFKPDGEFQVGQRCVKKIKDSGSSSSYQTNGFVSESAFSRVVIAAESASITIEKAKKYEELKNRGVVLHKALSYIKYPEDAEKAIARLKTEGLVTEENEDKFIKDLVEILKTNEVIKWFGKEWEVKAEKEMIMPDGRSYKPDRVLLKNDKAVVVDYKTGAKKKEHTEQISGYAAILKEMGYKDIEKYILYVPERKVVKVA